MAGVAGSTYQLAMWNPKQVSSAEGAQVKDGKLTVSFPSPNPDIYVRQKVTIHFAGNASRRH
jgi:hypothetical protein